MRKIALLLVLAMVFSIFAVGCKSEVAQQSSEDKNTEVSSEEKNEPAAGQGGQKSKDEELHLVFVTPLIAHPVWLVAKEGFETAAKDFNFKGDWVGPQGLDVNEMIKQIEIAITEKADGIITMGLNPEAMVPVLNKANNEGIPVVIVNSDVPDAPRLAYLGTDPANLGQKGAEAVQKKLGDTPIKAAGMVAALDYKIGNDMINGYKSVFEKTEGFEYLTTVESKSDMLTAVQQWQNVFNTYPEVNVSINVAGEAGPAAGKVVEEMNLQDKVTVIAIDDMQETLDGIRKGTIYATMTQNFFRMGYQAAQWLCEYQRDGKKPPQLINDSGTMVVTKENIDTYAEDMKDPSKW